MRRFAQVVFAGAVVVGAGCATRGGAVKVTPEASIAATIQQFQKDADDFAASRRAVVRERQRLLDEAEADTARAKARTEQIKTLWQIAGDQEKLQLYDGILAASQQAASALDAIDTLVEEHRANQARLDTKANIRQDKLAAVAKALLSLGSDDSLKDVAKFYVGFIAATKDQIEALQKQATSATPSADPSAGGGAAEEPDARGAGSPHS